MKNRIKDAIQTMKADYVEIRIEEYETTGILFRSEKLEKLTENNFVGGNVRVFHEGGWGFSSFNNLNNLEDNVKLAFRMARCVAAQETALAPVPREVAQLRIDPKDNPRRILLSKKLSMLEDYNGIIFSHRPAVESSTVSYSDVFKKVTILTSDGCLVSQEKADYTMSASALARRYDTIQKAVMSFGTVKAGEMFKDRGDKVEEIVKRSVDMLSASPVKGGRYTVVLDPYLAGTFIHEAFGHLSEADSICNNPRLCEVLAMGKRFGPDFLSIGDGAAIPGHRGSYLYDDEGVPSKKSYLVKDGVLTGRLHSRETAHRMNEPPTGNARAMDHRFSPIVRMTNTFVEPGNTDMEDMISGIKLGILACGTTGGQTTQEMFTFRAQHGYMIRKGKIAEPVRNVMLTGNVFESLKNIEAVGDEIVWSEGGGCGKGGQFPLPRSKGCPALMIRDVVVGGV